MIPGSCWIVFIHAVQGHPDGLLQFSRVKLLRSSLRLFHLAVVVILDIEKSKN